jgi:glycosyltransferase involved in cell wall biosynthesis
MDRKNDIESATVYVGCDIRSFDTGAEKNIGEVQKSKEEFWVSYAGSIGTSYDISTLIKAAKEIEDKGYYNIKFKIMGNGPLFENMKSLSKELGVSNVDLMGYMEYSKMAAYLKASDVVVNSFVKGAPQSIVNKIGDYLASESAMINTLENPEFTKLVKDDDFGINIEPENIGAMTDAVEKLYKDKELTERLSINARKCAETKFDRNVSYKKIVSVVESVILK